MPIERAKPVAVKTVAPVEKYPIRVIEGDYQGKKFLRVTTNEQNHKFDAFSGGAGKIKTLFGIEKGGDAVLKLLAEWAIEEGQLTREQLIAWYEKFSSQLESMIRNNDDEFSRPKHGHTRGQSEPF